METPASTATAPAPEHAPKTHTPEIIDLAAQDPLKNAGLWLKRRGWATIVYLTRTEVHTYAFSVAANAILSFFPFVVLLMTLVRRVFNSPAMYAAIEQVLREYLPTADGRTEDFIVRNLKVMAAGHGGAQLLSLGILLFTSTGVFLPLEVALNEVWGIKKNRNYLGNQLISLGLAFGCGVLALTSIGLTAGNQWLVQKIMLGYSDNFVFRSAAWVIMKFFAILCTIAIFFIIYWLLPNGKIKARAVLPAAIVTGLLLEIAKYIYILCLPLLDFKEVYGPFSISVTLMFWAFIAGMLLLGGAHLSASERDVEHEPATPIPEEVTS